ncbi:exported hypothetical protein [uncultured Paludibacter sp.]|uniref:Secretion system C-terminal sorting domain-containing protein n=1 Tax=uncultured Paludibacter sp. TaxID=497635 RepID=A0A653A9U0_9BACT|nr:exported hypothetical protein [uncultured Paludibacter sp.]
MKKALLFLQIFLSPLFTFGLTYNVTVPTGTKVCYIAGEMNGWSQQEMNKVDDTHYTLDIAIATTSQKYKYCSGPSWAYVENIADNRSYSTTDVVTSWTLIYDPNAIATDITYTVTVPEGTDVCYFAGLSTGWVHKQMSRVDATHFKIIVNSGNKDIYKYCSGPDWAYEEVDANGQSISNRNYNSSDIVAKWKQVYYSAPIGVTYNVTVPSGTNTCYLSGDMNNWSFTPMIKTDDTHFMVNIPDAKNYQKYIYYSGPDLAYKEKKSDDSNVADRSFSYYDVVEKWSSIYSPGSSISLTSNFSQQSYECETTLPITWTSSNIQNVRVLFSGDYGLTWSEIASVPAGNGMYNWTLPSKAFYQCKIMICDASNNLVSSATKEMFVVYNHLPEKVDPLLKNYYQVFTDPYNEKYPVTTTADSDNINGKVGNACGPTAVSNILAYWEFPRKGFGARTFTDIKNCTWSADFSSADYNFDLTNDQLTTSSPQALIDANATLMYHAGVSMHDIYRSGNSVGVLNAFKQYFGYNAGTVELCRDDYLPEQWEKIMKSELSLGRPQMIQGWANYFEDGGYGGHWFMCDGYSADNLFHISLDYGENGGRKYCPLYEFDYYKMRNWTFAYLEPEKNGRNIQLIFPVGEENWKQGTVKNIQWTSTGISNVKIEFTENGGESWTTIANNISANLGNYNITLPTIISTKCKIRVSDTSDINIYSRNKTNFSIYDTKSLQLISSISSSVQRGVILPLRWTSKGVNTVTIEYSLNNGQTWDLITEKNADDFVYKWIIPNVISSNCKVRITDKSDNSLLSESSPFSIISNSILGGPYPVDENTLALYHFDNDYFNSVSTQTYAYSFNTTDFISNNENKMDYALRIDNTNSDISSCVVLPYENPLSLIGDWTIEFWFKINSWGGTSTAYPFLFIKSGANYFIFLDVASKSLHVGYDYEGGAENLYLPSNSLELNKWYHILYTRNTTNSTLNCQLHDINRQELISKSANYNPLHIPKTNTEPINIGGYAGGSNVQFDGYIDEVRISNIVRDFVSTGINTVKTDPLFSIYPNPSNGIIHINWKKGITEGEISFMNNLGQILLKKNITEIRNNSISLKNFPEGIYYIKLSDKNNCWTEKIILK